MTMATMSPRGQQIADIATIMTSVGLEALAALPVAEPVDIEDIAAINAVARAILADLTDAELATLTVAGTDMITDVARTHMVPAILARVREETAAAAAPWLGDTGPLHYEAT